MMSGILSIEKILQIRPFEIEDKDFLIGLSNGDGRRLLNGLELAIKLTRPDDTGKIIAHCIGLPPNDAKQPRRVGHVPFSATFQYAKVEYATPQAKQAKDQSQLRYALFLNAGAEPSESFVVFWVCL